MDERRSWLESRHLSRAAGGNRALAQLHRLDAAVADALLERTDTIATISVSLAHCFFIAATAAASSSALRFDDWTAMADRVLGADHQGRNALEAFLALDPEALARIDPVTLDAWLHAVQALTERSRRLAAGFAASIGAALCRAPESPGELLGAWQRAVDYTLDAGQWRGEFLAGRLLETTDALWPSLAAEAVEPWAHFFVRIGLDGRSAQCPPPPPGLERLSPALQRRVLQAATAVAAKSAADGGKLAVGLSTAAAALTPAAAADLVTAVESACAEAGIADAVALAPAVAHELGPEAMALLCGLLRDTARQFPAGVAPYLRTMDRAFEEGGADGVAMWAEHGARIGATNRDAGIAHFRLESRTSHKVLVQHSVAVTFEEVEPMLQRYLLMLARRPLQLASGMGTWYRPPLTPAENRLVRLSERVDLCATAEENQLFYKLAAAHAAGRWEFGTYDLSIDEQLRARLADIAAIGVQSSDDRAAAHDNNDLDAATGLVGFLDSFPNPLLASVVFQLLDGARIDAALERSFRGLARDFERLGRLYAANPPAAAPERTGEALLEAIFLMSIGRLPPGELPARLQRYGPVAERMLARLRRPEAVVRDSADLLLDCYGALAMAAAQGELEAGASLGVIELGGATVVDVLDYDDGDAAPPPNPYGSGSTNEDRYDVRGDPGQQSLEVELGDGEQPPGSGGKPLTPEELRDLIEQGVDIEISEGRGEAGPSLGLYITDLIGKLPAEAIERLREATKAGDTAGIKAWLAAERGRDHHYYDEWDYLIRDYRRRWCCLTEAEIEGDGGGYYHRALARSGDLVSKIKREFLMMRPDQFRKVRGMEDGDEFDLTALVDAHADRRRRKSPTERVYVARRREERDVATLFLVDMSASTDEPLPDSEKNGDTRRVIDVTKDTLVVMANVLDEIGDAYAIYGFSGHGRNNVEFYRAKSFNERLGPDVRTRLGGIEPKRSTRMGAALRHAARKLAQVNARARHLILLSDGFPQDYDYGEDRTSNTYGIQDTMVALQELESQGVKTFCITVDPAGHDYLGDMCPASRYAVIDDINALPEEMPHIYRTVTRG